MRNLVLCLIWGIGLLMLSLPLTAQSLFPGMGSDPDLTAWVIMFFIGAAFTVFMYVVQRWMKAMDNLAESVQGLAIESAKAREWKKSTDKDLNIHKRRLNRMTDWINKHTNLHAKCPACPESNEI